MAPRLSQFLPLLIALACVAASAEGVRWPPLAPAPPLAAKVVYAEETAAGDFDLRVDYKVGKRTKEWQGVFVLLKQDDANMYRLSFSPESTTLARVHLGLALRLASGPGVGRASSGRLLARRRGASIHLYAGSRLLLAASDDTFSEGTVGYGSIGSVLDFDDALLQPVQPVLFSDDFMRSEEEEGEWAPVSGTWQVKSLQNPTRSANAFTYIGRASRGAAVSLAGHWFWSDYRFGASLMATGTRGVGLVAYRGDDGGYLLFEWTGRTGKSSGVRRLVQVQDGKRKTLAEAKGGYRPGQWYQVALSIQGGEVTALIDGAPVCTARVAPLPGGRAGLYVDDGKPAYFDDVWCEPERVLTYRFTTPGGLGTVSHGAWQELGGQWQIVAEEGAKGAAGDLRCRVRTASPARALVGSASWSDYKVSGEVERVTTGSSGICLGHQDEGEYALLRGAPGDPDTLELVRVTGGARKLLASAPAPRTTRPFRRLAARIDRGVITAWADGHKLFERFDASLAGGGAGLYAEDCPEARFGDLTVSFAPVERTPVFTAHEVFEGEVSMAGWAAAQSDWAAGKTKVGDAEVECLWHRAPFFGDVEIEAEAAPAKGELGLVVSASEQAPGSGYLLTATGSALVLSRRGEVVAKTPVGANLRVRPDAERVLVGLRREGGTVVATVDGVARLSFQDDEPLAGLHAGWYATNASAAKESVNVYSGNVITDTFRRAPTAWREAGGTWEVRSRWQCDPRWSFFSGNSLDGAAVLWHKRGFAGDVTVEFAAGIQMAREHGSYKDYGRDLNVTLCADGKSIESGYSFVFAGWGNEKNAIVRQGKVVAEAPPPKLDDSIHRQWFLVRAEKRGDLLRFFVDDKLVCEYKDPKPLAGTRMALWSYRCGIMLARFRVSAESIGAREPVDGAWPAVSRTFYDTADTQKQRK